MGLEITNETIENFNNSVWDTHYQNHLFYNFIKKSKDKSNLFDEFLLYLEGLSFHHLDSYFAQLEERGFTTQKELILSYWQLIQKKSTIFATILQSSIQ